MITLTNVIRKMRTTITLFRMSAVRWLGFLLMSIPPITRKRMPTMSCGSNFKIKFLATIFFLIQGMASIKVIFSSL